MKVEFLDLGKQPIANAFRDPKDQNEEFFFDLKVGYDPETHLVSLMNFVDKSMLFHEDYKYHTSANPVMVQHFENAAEKVKSFVGLTSKDKVLEIGSNDGAFLKNFPIQQAVAVEPCGNFARLTQSKGYRTFPKFWNGNTADEVVNYANQQFHLIYSANCFCHIPEIVDAFKAVSKALHVDGVFVFEDPSLLQTIQRISYDQFYDEHAHIFSLTALKSLLAEADMKMINVEQLDVHGGTNRIYAVKKDTKRMGNFNILTALKQERQQGILSFETYQRFAKKVEQNKVWLKDQLLKQKKENKRVIGYGASSKSTVVYNYCQIGTDLIECVSDTTDAKIGLNMPGVGIPIKSYDEVFKSKVDCAFLGAWNYRQDIEIKEKKRIQDGLLLLSHV